MPTYTYDITAVDAAGQESNPLTQVVVTGPDVEFIYTVTAVDTLGQESVPSRSGLAASSTQATPSTHSEWEFVLADLATGTAIGEIVNASERELVLLLNRLPTATFQVRLSNPMSARLLNANVLLKVYQQRVLRFIGPVVSVEEAASGEGGTLKVNAAGAFWRLTKRLIGKNGAGYSQGSAGSQVDRGQIAASILAAVNAEGDTGIRLGIVTPSAPGYVSAWRFMSAADAISQLSATLDGYDFEVAPTEPTSDASGLQIGMLIVAPFIGQQRPEAIFEYGVGKRNVASYTRPVTLDGLLNLGWNLPEGFPDSGTIVTSPVGGQPDATSLAQWGRMEALVTGDVTVDAMRQKLVDEHVRIRKNPRQVIAFEPAVNAPRLGTDYMVGDVVTARAVANGSARFNGLFRVYGVTVSINEEATVTYKLELIPYSA